MQFEDLIYEIRNGVAWIIINRPDKMNAFRGTTCEELNQGALQVRLRQVRRRDRPCRRGRSGLLHWRRPVGARQQL